MSYETRDRNITGWYEPEGLGAACGDCIHDRYPLAQIEDCGEDAPTPVYSWDDTELDDECRHCGAPIFSPEVI